MSELEQHLAKICANIINAQGLSQEQALRVGAQILFNIAHGPSPKARPAVKEIAASPKHDKTEAETPQRVAGPGKVIVHAGGSCFCKCGKELYKVVKPVFENMTLDDFIAAFEPVGHGHRLQKGMGMRNLNGNITVDCLVCKEPLGVCLTGTFAMEGDLGPGEVGSVDESSVGSV